MSKRPIFIFVFTFILMMCPSIMLFNRGGYAYAIPFTFLIVLFIYLNNFNWSHRNNYRKAITAIPIIMLLYFLAIPKNGKSLELKTTTLSDLKATIILACISVFIATISALLILKRTKGEKAHD